MIMLLIKHYIIFKTTQKQKRQLKKLSYNLFKLNLPMEVCDFYIAL